MATSIEITSIEMTIIGTEIDRMATAMPTATTHTETAMGAGNNNRLCVLNFNFKNILGSKRRLLPPTVIATCNRRRCNSNSKGMLTIFSSNSCVYCNTAHNLRPHHSCNTCNTNRQPPNPRNKTASRKQCCQP